MAQTRRLHLVGRTSAAAILLLIGIAAAAYLRGAGRVWWCTCAAPTLFVDDPASAHNSQHLFDWYSFSHLLHGVLFFWTLRLILAAVPYGKRIGLRWRLAIAVLIEAAWEMVENSPFIIDRYRTATASLGYEGDSIVNSMGDLAFCIAGFFLARVIGWKWSLALFVVVELVMLWAIRDNLTLNVLMLVHPLESVKHWQMGL